ncbi:MAG: M48 family metalloprotease [Phycisphaerae bacterium]|nr:M48 family metalloprotease [Phycisphaerae bacterium]
MSRVTYRWTPVALLGLCSLSFITGCTTNIATGRSQLDALSREDEIALGEEALPQLTEEYGGAVTDPALNQYVTGVAMSMVRHTEGDYATLPWKITLLNSDVINAFALPGGKVFVSRALAEKFTSEAQLAGVLGHEIGHVTAEHADRSIQNQLPTMILAGIGSVLAGNDAAMQAAVGVMVDASGTFALKFSRDQENEADKLGMRYMVAAGYHPKGMLEVMQVLAAASKGQNPPEWLSTHPAPESRIEIIQKRLDTRYKDIVNDPKYQTFDARFRTEFLERIKTVPAPKKVQKGMIDLERPETWCLHCATRPVHAAARPEIPGAGM